MKPFSRALAATLATIDMRGIAMTTKQPELEGGVSTSLDKERDRADMIKPTASNAEENSWVTRFFLCYSMTNKMVILSVIVTRLTS